MATIIHKDGKTIAVEYPALKRHLDAGWSTCLDAPAKAVESVEEAPKPKRRATRKKVKDDDE
jgi:hypothetical protein